MCHESETLREFSCQNWSFCTVLKRILICRLVNCPNLREFFCNEFPAKHEAFQITKVLEFFKMNSCNHSFKKFIKMWRFIHIFTAVGSWFQFKSKTNIKTKQKSVWSWLLPLKNSPNATKAILKCQTLCGALNVASNTDLVMGFLA